MKDNGSLKNTVTDSGMRFFGGPPFTPLNLKPKFHNLYTLFFKDPILVSSWVNGWILLMLNNPYLYSPCACSCFSKL